MSWLLVVMLFTNDNRVAFSVPVVSEAECSAAAELIVKQLEAKEPSNYLSGYHPKTLCLRVK